jgi:hypothetical protein
MQKQNPRIFALILLLLISFLSSELFSQDFGRVKGRVLSQRTGAPLANANVYLANTTLGTNTNKGGHYTIDKIPPGSYTLIVSYMGYTKQQLSITAEPNKTTRINIDLKESPTKLSGVNIVYDEEREKLLKTFEVKLLGFSPNVDSCEFVNPDVIALKMDDDGKLIAKSDSFITIINNGLGYKIDILLQKFRWDTETDIGSYAIYPRFTELEPKNPAQMEKWKENRNKAYLGSFRHFLHAVATDSLFAVNYKIFCGSVSDFNFNRRDRVERKDMDITFSAEMVKFCLGEPYLIENGYLSHLTSLELKMNRNCLIIPYDCLMISYNGILLNPDKVQLSGFWANQRIADALPYDYIPSKK